MGEVTVCPNSKAIVLQQDQVASLGRVGLGGPSLALVECLGASLSRDSSSRHHRQVRHKTWASSRVANQDGPMPSSSAWKQSLHSHHLQVC